MNILFFLTPKSSVTYLYEDDTFSHAFQKMTEGGYTAIPIIDQEGKYTGTVNEGDFLRTFLEHGHPHMEEMSQVLLRDVPRRQSICPVRADANMEDLLMMTMNQSFVPVIDGRDMLIGIVTRRAILQYYYQLTHQADEAQPEGIAARG